jgi:hypothetical protein
MAQPEPKYAHLETDNLDNENTGLNTHGDLHAHDEDHRQFKNVEHLSPRFVYAAGALSLLGGLLALHRLGFTMMEVLSRTAQVVELDPNTL